MRQPLPARLAQDGGVVGVERETLLRIDEAQSGRGVDRLLGSGGPQLRGQDVARDELVPRLGVEIRAQQLLLGDGFSRGPLQLRRVARVDRKPELFQARSQHLGRIVQHGDPIPQVGAPQIRPRRRSGIELAVEHDPACAPHVWHAHLEIRIPARGLESAVQLVQIQ